MIYQRSLQILATDVFKTKIKFNLEFCKISYNLQIICKVAVGLKDNIKLVRYRTKGISHLGPEMWSLLP